MSRKTGIYRGMEAGGETVRAFNPNPLPPSNRLFEPTGTKMKHISAKSLLVGGCMYCGFAGVTLLMTAAQGMAQAPNREHVAHRFFTENNSSSQTGLATINATSSDQVLISAMPKLADEMLNASSAKHQAGRSTVDELLGCWSLATQLKVLAARATADRSAELSAMRRHVDGTRDISRRVEALFKTGARGIDASGYHLSRYYFLSTLAELAKVEGQTDVEIAARERAIEETTDYLGARQASYEAARVSYDVIADGLRHQRDAWIALTNAKKDEASRAKMTRAIDRYVEAAQAVEKKARVLREIGSRGGSDWNYYEALHIAADAKATKARTIQNTKQEILIWESFRKVAKKVISSPPEMSSVAAGLVDPITYVERLNLYYHDDIRLAVLKSDRDEYLRLLTEQLADYLDLIYYCEEKYEKGERNGSIENVLYANAAYARARMKMAELRRSRYMGQVNGRSVFEPSIE